MPRIRLICRTPVDLLLVYYIRREAWVRFYGYSKENVLSFNLYDDILWAAIYLQYFFIITWPSLYSYYMAHAHNDDLFSANTLRLEICTRGFTKRLFRLIIIGHKWSISTLNRLSFCGRNRINAWKCSFKICSNSNICLLIKRVIAPVCL